MDESDFDPASWGFAHEQDHAHEHHHHHGGSTRAIAPASLRTITLDSWDWGVFRVSFT